MFLGKEGMFKDYTVLIGQFYLNEFKSGILQTLGKEFCRIGISFDLVYSENDFADLLNHYDIAILISSSERKGD